MTVTDVSEWLAGLAPSEQSLPGYLFWLSRPRFWFYLAGPVILGVVYGASTPSAVVSGESIALFLYFLVPANVFLYGINDYFDREIDAENPKKSPEGREQRYRDTPAVPVAIGLAAVAGIAFVPVLPPAGIVALAGFLALGAGYSAPPARFKTTPALDSLSNGLYVLPGVVAFTLVAGSLPPWLAVVGGWLWTMGMHTFSAIPDIEPDRRAGIRTTATLLGRGATLAYCAVCWSGAAVAMGLIHPGLGAVFAAYPVFLVWIAVGDVGIDRAYWWFPVVNTLAGAVLTIGGIWRIIHG